MGFIVLAKQTVGAEIHHSDKHSDKGAAADAGDEMLAMRSPLLRILQHHVRLSLNVLPLAF